MLACRVFGLSGHQIWKQRLVGVADEKTRQLAAQPVAQAFGEFHIIRGCQPLQDEGAEQHLAAGIVGAVLFAEAGLQGFLLRFSFKGKTMARRSIEVRIAQLEAQKKTLQARLGKQDRANDTRRKVLLGALLLQRLDSSHDKEFSERLRSWLSRELPGFLTREGDRALLADLIAPKAAQGIKAAG